MSDKKYTVQDGEHLPMIASKHGFAGIGAIWNHPDNAEIKAKRKNPNLLVPGDVFTIPEPKQRTETRGTDQTHQFVANVTPLVLNVKLRDLSDVLIERQLSATTRAGTHDVAPQGGLYTIAVHPQDQTVTLKAKEAPALKLSLVVGGLEPVTEVTGQQDRLNNLGYFAGFSRTPDSEQMRWAVEEFQKDHQQSKGLKVTGICDGPTQAALVDVHGI